VRWDANDTGNQDNFELLQNGQKIGDLTQSGDEFTSADLRFDSNEDFEIRAANVCGSHSFSF
jgi:hypothetical protein